MLRHTRTPVVLDVRVVTGTGGGPEKTILNSPRFLLPGGYKMLCAYLHPPADPGFEALRRKAQARDAPLISIPDRGPVDLRVIPLLLKICRENQVSIWHAHDYKSNALGLVLAQLWPMRLITTLHGYVERTRRTPLYYTLDRLCLRHYERVYCVSADLYRDARKAGVPAARCQVLENGIDVNEFRRRHTPVEARRSLGLSPEQFLIGAVGRLSAEKGFDVLLHAIYQLRQSGRDARLVILGDGSARPELERLSAELDLSDHVKLAGFQSDTIPWYEAMDAYALSSHREGLPNVLLEAMALEVPIVASRVGGVPELIQDEADGLLVHSGDPAALAAALARLYDSTDERRRLSAAARDTIERRYSFARRMHILKESYDQLLQHRQIQL